MSTDFQITIPDLEDSDFGASSTPFGRHATGFGSAAAGSGFGSSGAGFGSGSGFGNAGGSFSSNAGGGAAFGGSGLDSPTSATPMAIPDRNERGYFQSHGRGDSVASIDSVSSATASSRYTGKTTPFGHSSQSSVTTAATSASPFTKKPSFASLRNAFKSGKSSEPPPVPSIDYQSHVMKSAYNRSTSSLTKTARPGTPASMETKHRGTPSLRKGHGYARSQHSHSGSIFHASDQGSDGHGATIHHSPPPVPRVPHAFGQVSRSETPDFDEDKVIMNPKTPADYALHAVFISFAASAEGKIDEFLRQPLDQDPLLPEFMGPGTDSAFDDTLQSLGKIAFKHTKAVIDSILRWRRSQNENVGSDIIKFHISQPPVASRIIRMSDVPGLLNERKSLASIYIMCRSLIAVLQAISVAKDALSENMGYMLSEMIFEQFKKPDTKQSPNHRTNADLYATLLGHIAKAKFVSVTDRFVAELGPIIQGQVIPKEVDSKFDNVIRAMRYIQIKVFPPEDFEEGAEFFVSVAKAFGNTHGLRLKSTFAEALVHILHPIVKTAQEETNVPDWAQAMEMIYPKARDMATKPRYWGVAYPLVVTSLCAAPQDYFRKNFSSCFETILSKVKEKSNRIPVMNGVLRLVWTYLYRCQEPLSTTTTKLDGILKYFFPPKGAGIYPHDEHLEPFIYIVHFILSRHFDYGSDFCLELMQESSIKAGHFGTNVAPERTAIAVQAVLLSLNVYERDSKHPVWPSSVDFTAYPSWDDYPTNANFLPPKLTEKPAVMKLVERTGSTLATIALACSKTVGSMSVFDEQWTYSRLHPAYEEPHNYVVRRNPEGGSVAYPMNLVSYISILQTCFQAWPRLLDESIAVSDAIDMLLRGAVHVEPLLAEVAVAALKRFMEDDGHASMLLSRFWIFLFHPSRIAQDTGTKLTLESALLRLWVDVVDLWIRSFLQRPRNSMKDEQKLLTSRGPEVEAAALFLLSHDTGPVHSAGVKIMRLLGLLVNHFYPTPPGPEEGPQTAMHYVELFHGRITIGKTYFTGFDDLLDKPELARLEQWCESKKPDVLLRIADSSNDKDRKLWRFIFPAFLQQAMDSAHPLPSTLRESIAAAASKYHPTISQLAGLSSRPMGISSRTMHSTEKDGSKLVKENRDIIDQWSLWVKILSSTAKLSESSRPALTQLGREHSRAPSDANFERERLSTTRGLFRYLTPFLDSEYTLFRDAAVVCISSFPSNAYPQLLEDLSLLAGRQFYDDPRAKAPTLVLESNLHPTTARQFHDDSRYKPNTGLINERVRRQERLHSAVAHIYYLTAPFVQHQRAAGKQAVLAHVLKFIRNTQTFLTSLDARDNHTLQRLRRYFCGTLERVFDGLASLKDTDRFIPSHMHLSLYRLCEEWCQFGPQSEAVRQRLILMQRAAASTRQQEEFQQETSQLSYAAVGAMAVLCQKALYPPDMSSGSPTDKPPPEHLKALTPMNVLERLSAILTSGHVPTQNRGKKALRSLLTCPQADTELFEEALRRAIVASDEPATSYGRFFEVVDDIVTTTVNHGFSFAQVVWLGLSNLCHKSLNVRRLAFDMLEAVHHQTGGTMSMSQFEPSISSLAATTYVRAHHQISQLLAAEHLHEAPNMLSTLALWLPLFPSSPTVVNTPILLLQSLENWVPNIELMTEDKSGLSRAGQTAMYHMLALTKHFSQTHSEQVLSIWTKLVEPPNQANGHATVRFLLEQSPKVGSAPFMECAATIVASLCQTSSGRQIFEDLASVIEPARMLPTIEHKLEFPNAHDMELWSDLDAIFGEDHPRLQLGSAQYAWLYLSDVALQRYWELQAQLPVLLQALFIHMDHRNSSIRQRATRMLFQILRSWIPGYDELPDQALNPGRQTLKAIVTRLEKEVELKCWREDETAAEVEPKMKWLCGEVLGILAPLCPDLSERWGSLALTWGTACSIRGIAFRSLQLFRALTPRVKKNDFAILLGRLTNTISSSDENMHAFTSEVISTINTIATLGELDASIVPQLFWFACAGLSTTVEQEFSQILELLHTLIRRVDLDDQNTIDHLLSQRPVEWKGSTSLQSPLMKGLRSANTSEATMKVLQQLAKFRDGRLIDTTEDRLRELYTVALPWCLEAMSKEAPKPQLAEFAENISELATQEGRQSISRIMVSFARGHFRTRDDFLRQSALSLREHYGQRYWTETVTALLSLVLNRQSWLRVQAMQLLKMLFQQRETRGPVELLGSELLMPLLRLLETDLALQALDVLEEPIVMSGGGPAAKHVLRMSMHAGSLMKNADTVTTVFGVPDESGWCIAKADSVREACRANVMAVFDTCQIHTRPSQISFQPEVEVLAMSPISLTHRRDQSEDDLNDLVQNLHELTTFFQDNDTAKRRRPTPAIYSTGPNRRLEARVAAILAKSTAAETVSDAPQTPFLDVFRVGNGSSTDADEEDEDSDEYSDESEEEDLFVFDSQSVYRGHDARYH
ncbi:uncharacterized protein SCHCODRAFT_02636387 [Schizophyllum commune H4-8]|uniref:uncharacterized protein n=1 Tax=Schizophyllum commune (strain H4-8 / FGSC 9210) TaxID=578458 RepID=UPI00215EE4A4|nr:uncharacterized protein SCHCODRAFT_02636387 [Schizophyllum commune H4-8]KAI5888318.1 hypothetical protein SCHCODRAFT_02636387 [Schizophyllum commune H4-8]